MYFFCSWVMDWQNDILEKIKILFRGIGQVMFQNNALSGLLMLVGILLNSWQMALLAIANGCEYIDCPDSRIFLRGYTKRIVWF